MNPILVIVIMIILSILALILSEIYYKGYPAQRKACLTILAMKLPRPVGLILMILEMVRFLTSCVVIGQPKMQLVEFIVFFVGLLLFVLPSNG